MVAELILLFLVRAISRDFNEYGRKNAHCYWKKNQQQFSMVYAIDHRHDVNILKLGS